MLTIYNGKSMYNLKLGKLPNLSTILRRFKKKI